MATGRVLYLLGCAAPPVLEFPGVVERAQAAGWDVCVGLTPSAADWLSETVGVAGLAELTGHPVRVRHRRPSQVDPWPKASVALVAPLTFNSLNAWALGLTGVWVPAFAAEAPGKGVPVVAVPCVNPALQAHPQFGRSVAVLEEMGVRVLPSAQPSGFPWDVALAECVGSGL